MKEFHWQTHEYAHVPRGSDWYWTVGIIAAAISIVSIIFGDALFGVVIAISAFALALFASHNPKMISVEINDEGVTVDKVLYPFNSIESFFVDTKHHRGERLILKSKKLIMPLITVPVRTNVTELREFLSKHSKEEHLDEGILHAVLERIGF